MMVKLVYPYINIRAENIILLVLLVAVFLLLNTLYFISLAASPIIRDDGWYFLSSQIQPWIEHGFSWEDIFGKRRLTDHAQPLNKLFLFLNFKVFNLDFKYEALAGFLGLLLILFLFLSIFIRKAINQTITLVDAGFFTAAILTLTSFNSIELYSWPLVTFSYLPFLLSLLLIFLAWRFINNQSTIIALVVSAAIFILIGDTASIISWLSLTITVMLIAMSDSTFSKKRVLLWIACSAAVVMAYFFVVNGSFLGEETQSKSGNGQLNLYSPVLYLEIIRIVFSSSLIHSEHIARAGDCHTLLSWVVAIPVFYFYIGHFYSVIFKRQQQNIVDFFVTFVLVHATLSVAAIVVGRVPEYGIGYLNQPRYVLVYQLIPFALLIKYCFFKTQMERQMQARKLILIATLPFLLCIQFYFNVHAYAAVPWISKWIDGQQKAIANYVNNPTLPAGECTNYSSPVCHLPASERTELINVMIKNKLNMFNHEFQWKYKIFPAIEIKLSPVSGWGPQVRNVQSTDGIWVKLLVPIVSADINVQVKINDESINQIVFTGDLMTFNLPDKYKSTPGAYKIEYSIDNWKTSMFIGNIEIKN